MSVRMLTKRNTNNPIPIKANEDAVLDNIRTQKSRKSYGSRAYYIE